MDPKKLCRICLSKNPGIDIMLSEVGGKSYAEVIMFCLGVMVEEDAKITTKLCLQCMEKLLSFNEFKSLALQTDMYLKSLDVKNEIFIEIDEVAVKEEELSINSNDNINIKDEPVSELPNLDHHDGESDDESHSVPKNIKQENIENKTKRSYAVMRMQMARKRKKKFRLRVVKTHNVKEMCELCGEMVSRLKVHLANHPPVPERILIKEETDKIIKCEPCNETFLTNSAKEKHNRTCHVGYRKTCKICKQVVHNINVHRRTVHKKEPYECDKCGKRYLIKKSLHTHMKSHEEPVECDLCNKKFSRNTNLKRHKLSVHYKERPHLCEICSRAFSTKTVLITHIKSHSNEKNFKCPDCGKFLKTLANLRAHREIHSDVKKYGCELCPRKFMRKRYLWQHMMSHTKDKRFACSYCGMRFHRIDHRSRHEYTAHQRHMICSTEPQPLKEETASQSDVQ